MKTSNFKNTNAFKMKASIKKVEEPIEEETAKEINHVGVLMKEQADRMKMNCDTEYFSVIFFTCKKDRDQFLKNSKFDQLTTDKQYLNGYLVAEKMGIKVDKTKINIFFSLLIQYFATRAQN